MIPVVNARWGRYLRKGLAALLDEADAVRVPPRAAPIDKPVPERGLTTLAEEPTPLPRPVPERGLTTLEDELPSERIQEIPKQVSFPDKKTHWWLDELDQKGTVTLYHGTNIKNLDKIRREGLGTDKEGFTYLTPDPDTGVGYGVMARGEKASKGKRGKAYEQAPFEERALLEIEVPKEMLERNINLQRSDTSVKKLLGSDGLEKFEKANRQKVFGQENVPMDAQHNTPYYDLTEIRFKERISPELIKSFAIKKDRRKSKLTPLPRSDMGYLDPKNVDTKKSTQEALGMSDEDIQLFKETELPKLNKDRHKDKVIERAAKALDEEGGADKFEEFIRIKEERKPLKVYGTVPKIDSPIEIVAALGKKARDKGIIGLNKIVEDGEIVTSRFDIPAYSLHNVYVAAIGKGPKEHIFAYAPTARLKNVKFGVDAHKSFKIAGGKGKGPFATMKGKWVQQSPEEVQRFSQELMESGLVNKAGGTNKDLWTEIGFDPAARLSFYNRSTGDPIFEAEEVIQVGPMLLARGIRKPTSKELEKLKVTTEAGEEITYRHRGGGVERNPYGYPPRAI
jgi:hypothetical protein